MAGYSEDLAHIHHLGFGDFARGAAPALLKTLRAHGIGQGLVIDLGCGSGIWAQELLRAGYQVLGVDISPSMIRLARKQAPVARFKLASLLECRLPVCDAVTSIGECINYTFDPGNSRKACAGLFRRVYQALRPGGVFVFDFAEPGQLAGVGYEKRYAAGADWAVLLEIAEDRKRGILTRRMVSFRKAGRLYRKIEECHEIRLYRADELAGDLQRIGFRTRLFRRYGAMRLRAGCAGIVATRPRV